MASTSEVDLPEEGLSDLKYGRFSSEADVQRLKRDRGIAEQVRISIDNAAGSRPGTFAAAGLLEGSSLPSLTVDNTTYSLPLSSNDVQTIIGKSEKAPFGFGRETRLDNAIRSTWQIDAENLGLHTDDWTNLIRRITHDAVNELGKRDDNSNISARPHKLLLYQKGDGFKPHRDSEKTKGMFGTLVVVLPFEHTGGDLHVSHLQHEKVFKTDNLGSSDVYLMAWYSDVTHEIRPVQDGCRVVLTFNLISDSEGASHIPEVFPSQDNMLDDVLSQWAALESPAQAFCYAMDHRYTKQSLAPAALKDEDLHRFLAVSDACERNGQFYPMLGQIHKIVSRPQGASRTHSQYQSERITLGSIMTPHGAILECNIWKLPSYCIAKPPFYPKNEWSYGYGYGQDEGPDRTLTRWPDDYTGGEFLGNENADENKVYTDTVILILFKRSAIWFLSQEDEATSEPFKRLQNQLSKAYHDNEDPTISQLILKACHDTLRTPYGSHLSKDSAMGQVASAAMLIGNDDVWRTAVANIVCGFNEATFSKIGGLISSGQSKLVFTQTEMLQALSADIYKYLTDALPSITKMMPQDASTVLELVTEDNRYWDTLALPFIYQHLRNSTFMNALRIEMLAFSGQYGLPTKISTHLRSLVLEDCVMQFSLKDYLKPRNYSIHPHNSVHNVGSLKRLFLEAESNGFVQSATILHKIQEQAKSASSTEFKEYLEPFMKWLLTSKDITVPAILEFFHSIIATCIQRVVLVRQPSRYGFWPNHEDNSWARPQQSGRLDSCPYTDCAQCQATKEFLLDPNRSELIVPRDESYMHTFDLVGEGCYVFDNRRFAHFEFKKIAEQRDCPYASFTELLKSNNGANQISQARTYIQEHLKIYHTRVGGSKTSQQGTGADPTVEELRKGPEVLGAESLDATKQTAENIGEHLQEALQLLPQKTYGELYHFVESDAYEDCFPTADEMEMEMEIEDPDPGL